MDNKYKRLGKNTILVFLGNAGAKLIGFLLLPFYTRWLSVEDYGLTDILSVYQSFLLSIVSCCIADSIFIFPKNQAEETQKKYFSTGVAFACLMLFFTAIIFEVANITTNKIGISNSFTDNYWFIYGLLATSMFQQIVQQYTRAIDKMSVYSITGIILTVCTASFSFVFIPKWGVNGYVLAAIISNLITTLFTLLFSGSYKHFNIVYIKKTICIQMLKYSIPLIPNGIMWWLVGAFNRPLMESYVGMHDIGLYAVANKFPSILTMLFTIFNTSWQISVLEEFEKDGFSVFYNRVLDFMLFISVLGFLVISLSSKVLLHIFTTSDYAEAWVLVPILTASVIFSNIGSISGTVFAAVRQSKYFFYSSVWSALIAVIFNYMLIPTYGAIGAAISVLLSFIVMGASRVFYSLDYVSYRNKSIKIIQLLLVNISLLTILIENIIVRSLLYLLFIVLILLLNRNLLSTVLEKCKKIIQK